MTIYDYYVIVVTVKSRSGRAAAKKRIGGEKAMINTRETAAKIADAVLNYNPYTGPDPDDIIPGLTEQLATRAGCIEIINQLCEMLQDA